MLNLKNTLDGYLKNVEVIGNTVQDTNNLADIRSVGDKVEGQELYNISIQVDNGKGVSEVVEILSPVQLEKVGVIADRIICKDGIWGVEKHSKSVTVKGDETITIYQTRTNVIVYKVAYADFKSEYSNNIISNKFIAKKDITGNHDVEGICVYTNDNIYISINKSRLTTQDVKGFSTWLQENDLMVKYPVKQPQFIPLPHDQQVKLRTFAGQTNIAFLTEIPGQIKAQVPKSLGATVNTHTEQIADLHNSLERVKKLEETTVSTVETESNFTTVDATSNGYFEDVKLEGKTLVNLVQGSREYILTRESVESRSTQVLCETYVLDKNKDYTAIYIQISREGHTPKFNIFNAETSTSDYYNTKLFDTNTTGYEVVIKKINRSYNWQTMRIYYDNDLIGTTKFKLLLLEGDHTNNPPEYFEGLMSVGQDVEEVSVESVNENLFNVSKHNTLMDNGDYIEVTSHSNHFVEYKLLPNTEYLLCFNKYVGTDCWVAVDVEGHPYVNNGNINFRRAYTTDDSGILNISIRANTKENVGHKITNIRLMQRNSSDIYLPHQSNKKPLLYYNPTTETWEKPILREWDTIEKHSDGKYYYHKRSGEVVLNGSENWSFIENLKKDDTLFYHLSKTIGKNGVEVMCDKLIYKSHADVVDYECFRYHNGFQIRINKSRLSTQDVEGFKAWLKANPTTVVYELAQEEVYECTNIDLMTYSGETNYIINSGAISPKSLLKVHNNISNVVKILQEKVSLLENTFIAGLKSVLSGDMYSLATILYPEDFEQNDNIEQDIMVIPE